MVRHGLERNPIRAFGLDSSLDFGGCAGFAKKPALRMPTSALTLNPSSNQEGGP